MKVVAHLVDGNSCVMSGEVAEVLRHYFNQQTGVTSPIGWVSNGKTAINFAHVVRIEIVEEDAE
ncbi:hypothetical protein M5X06_12775 [Paenibacillus alvei]|uniref:Uncharacterized protein n=1 Tax=Paenibacillus alvei TaxID=44250 RepID=A0ABT4GUL7_PAEAL|nr:hypothetical protein [Paenibacillus alvei]MCY9760394.1 hypothetical protein [Paenibacillus alvei]MCY9767686.1 hypothetical protein [Paenibacillus alvei]